MEKNIKLSELIKQLKDYEKEVGGDIEVTFASREEGGFIIINQVIAGYTKSEEEKFIILIGGNDILKL